MGSGFRVWVRSFRWSSRIGSATVCIYRQCTSTKRHVLIVFCRCEYWERFATEEEGEDEVGGCTCSVGKRSCWYTCPVFAWLSALGWSHDRVSRSSLFEKLLSSFFSLFPSENHFVYSGVKVQISPSGLVYWLNRIILARWLWISSLNGTTLFLSLCGCGLSWDSLLWACRSSWRHGGLYLYEVIVNLIQRLVARGYCAFISADWGPTRTHTLPVDSVGMAVLVAWFGSHVQCPSDNRGTSQPRSDMIWDLDDCVSLE